ncbi:hypothetical protein R0J90_18335, partial [Micrococcus sp. SIMBA_144]
MPEWKYKKDLEEAARPERQQQEELEKEYGPIKENVKKAFSVYDIFPKGVVNGSEEYGGRETYYVFDKPMNTYFKLEVYENE